MNQYHDEEYDPQENSWDDWCDEEPEEIQCLYCKDILSSTTETFQHLKSVHSFDFQSTRQSLGLDFYQCIRLINYIRHKVRENNDYSCTTFNKTDSFFNDDIYLQPILEDDPFLFAFDEDCEDSVEETLDLNKIEPTTELEKKLTSLLLKSQQDLESLQEQFDDYKLTVKKTFYDTLEDKN